jgi:hypothetical protein
VLKRAASSGVSGGHRRVFDSPGREAFAMTAIPHENDPVFMACSSKLRPETREVRVKIAEGCRQPT